MTQNAMFCRPKKEVAKKKTGWLGFFSRSYIAHKDESAGSKRTKEQEALERQQQEEREREREQELRRLKDEVAVLQKQVADMDNLRYEIRRLQGHSSTWTSFLHTILHTLVLHPSLANTFRIFVNRQLREVIADMDIISTAECLSITLPATPERTPDIELCEAYAASGTTGTSLWRMRVHPGSVSADLHVTGKKMVKFRAELTVSFTFEGLFLIAMYPRGTDRDILPPNLPLPSTAGLITRMTKVPLDARRARVLGRVPSQPHCWLQLALIEMPHFEVPIQSKVKAANLALPVQDRIKAAIQKALAKVLQQRFVAPVSFLLPITINSLDDPAIQQLEEETQPTKTDQVLQNIVQLVGKDLKWEQAKDLCTTLDTTKSKLQALLQSPGIPNGKGPKVACAAMVGAYIQVTNCEQHQDWTELMEHATQFLQAQVGAERTASLMHTAKQLCIGQVPVAAPPAAQSASSVKVLPSAPPPPTATAPPSQAAPTTDSSASAKPPSASDIAGSTIKAEPNPAAPIAKPGAAVPTGLPPAPPAGYSASSSAQPVSQFVPPPKNSPSFAPPPAIPSLPAATPSLPTVPKSPDVRTNGGIPEPHATPEKASATSTPSRSQPLADHRREPSHSSVVSEPAPPPPLVPEADPAPQDTATLLDDTQEPAHQPSAVDNFADDLREFNAKVLKKLDDFKWSDLAASSVDKTPKSAQDEVLTLVKKTVTGPFGKWDQTSKASKGTLASKFCDAMGVSQSSTAAIISATGLRDSHKAASVASAALVVGYIQLTAPTLQRDWEELRQQATSVIAQNLGGADVDVASEVHSAAKIALLGCGVIQV